MSALPPYLYVSRYQAYYCRRVFPPDLRSTLGRTELKRSLGRTSRTVFRETPTSWPIARYRQPTAVVV